MLLVTPLYIAQSFDVCWKCNCVTPVYCLACEGFYDDESDDDWQPGQSRSDPIEGFTFCSQLKRLDSRVRELFARHAPGYRYTYSHAASESYFMNHCHECNTVQGDCCLSLEPDIGFDPISEEQAKWITLHEIEGLPEALEIGASPHMHSEDFFIEHATRRSISLNGDRR